MRRIAWHALAHDGSREQITGINSGTKKEEAEASSYQGISTCRDILLNSLPSSFAMNIALATW